MPQYFTPGVYVEEIEIGAKPIEGVSTNIAGFLGEAERGPLDPAFITNFDQFKKLYGGYVKGYLAHAVEGYFNNGGASCFVARIIGKGSATAKQSLKGMNAVRVEAKASGKEEEKIAITVEDLNPKSEDPLAFKLTVTPVEGSPEIKELTADSTKDNYYEKDLLTKVTLKRVSDGRPCNMGKKNLEFPAGCDKAFLLLVSENGVIDVKAQGPGKWGNSVSLIIGDAGLGKEDPDLFKLTVLCKDDIAETYNNLSPLPESSDYFMKRINGISNFISVESSLPIRPYNDNKVTLTGGSDGSAVSADDYDGLEEDQTHKSTGLKAFDKISEISLVCAPDENRFSLKEESHESDENSPGSTDESSLKASNVLADKLVTHCSNHKDRFAILQADEAPGAIQGIYPYVYTKYAATYYPWIRIIDPSTNMAKYVPPCGHVAGIYARTDTERGVHKAPANTPVRSVVDLKFDVVDAEQEILNPRGVNCIRSFPGRGILVWGARTSSLDPSWKYVNVSRLFIFVEKSIKEGIRWAVFEPNNEKLWSRVKQTVDQFLTTVWRTGALMGTTADQAFFVRCDRTTMTQDDIDNGRLVVLVGIAPTKPAEFVIFRIAQVAKGSDISGA